MSYLVVHVSVRPCTDQFEAVAGCVQCLVVVRLSSTKKVREKI